MSTDLGRGTRRFQRFVTLGGAKPSGRAAASARHPRPGPAPLGAPARVPQAGPAPLDPEPGHVRRGAHGGAGDPDLARQHHRRAAGGRRVRLQLPAPDRDLAVVHGPVRDLRRGRRRGPRPCAGGDAPPHAVRDDRPPPARRRFPRVRGLVRAPQGRRHRRRGGRDDPRRRRRHRGRRLRQRGGDHRRIGPGPQGAGHRHPQLGDRRHDAGQRPPRHPRHHRSGRDVPRPHDRARRGREAAADARTRSRSRSSSPGSRSCS